MQGVPLSLLGIEEHSQLPKLCEQESTPEASGPVERMLAPAHRQPSSLSELACQVEIMHGDADDCIPLSTSQLFVERLLHAQQTATTERCHLHVLPQGDHRLSSPQALELMCQLIAKVIEG